LSPTSASSSAGRTPSKGYTRAGTQTSHERGTRWVVGLCSNRLGRYARPILHGRLSAAGDARSGSGDASKVANGDGDVRRPSDKGLLFTWPDSKKSRIGVRKVEDNEVLAGVPRALRLHRGCPAFCEAFFFYYGSSGISVGNPGQGVAG
jgi:hypothetical protein